MTTHATIDIETLGTSSDTVVLTIGGIKFNLDQEKNKKFPKLYMV